MKHQALALCMLCVQLAAQVLAGTQFSSHVSVNTPARSYSHGVGDPLPLLGRRQRPAIRSYRRPEPPLTSHSRGYPRVKPSIPFTNEDVARGSPSASPWHHNNHYDEAVPIPLLPPSPYKVDSPDPESLWPEGLFLPPINPPRFGATTRSDNGNTIEADPDPFLLEGSEAVAAVARSTSHGPWYFHEIPHIESLLNNQHERIQNHLEPHVLGSIRYTWPFYRN